ncbi:hypothetical protein GQ54DRAFT_224719 [Martensiomyces pterosporus]|nr:hypothetical protein GQ54DRAFT_224719 [Martensiomyces pterosporus]
MLTAIASAPIDPDKRRFAAIAAPASLVLPEPWLELLDVCAGGFGDGGGVVCDSAALAMDTSARILAIPAYTSFMLYPEGIKQNGNGTTNAGLPERKGERGNDECRDDRSTIPVYMMYISLFPPLLAGGAIVFSKARMWYFGYMVVDV